MKYKGEIGYNFLIIASSLFVLTLDSVLTSVYFYGSINSANSMSLNFYNPMFGLTLRCDNLLFEKKKWKKGGKTDLKIKKILKKIINSFLIL